MFTFKIQAFDKLIKTEKEEMISGVSIITIDADSEKHALKKAQKILKKNNYRISEVYENNCQNNQKELISLFEKLIKKIK